jgi:hypothetical protein
MVHDGVLKFYRDNPDLADVSWAVTSVLNRHPELLPMPADEGSALLAQLTRAYLKMDDPVSEKVRATREHPDAPEEAVMIGGPYDGAEYTACDPPDGSMGQSIHEHKERKRQAYRRLRGLTI